MGKTSRKLNIVVFDYLQDWPEIKVLEEQGHEIWRAVTPENGKEFLIPASKFASADIILGPNCWLMDRDHQDRLLHFHHLPFWTFYSNHISLA